MLSFDTPISSDDIEKFKELKDETVFLLTGMAQAYKLAHPLERTSQSI